MLTALHLDGAERPVAVLLEGPALRLRRPAVADAFAPLARLARVVVHGTRVQWRTEALLACLEAGVPVAFLGRRGTLAGLLLPLRPPSQRAGLAAALDAAAALPGFRRRLEDLCRAEERRALLAALRAGPGWNCAELRPEIVRRLAAAHAPVPAAAEAVLALLRGLAAALVAEELARQGVGPNFLVRRSGGFPLAERLGDALAWQVWPQTLALLARAGAADAERPTPALRRAAIAALEGAGLRPACQQMLARLAAAVGSEV
ncbi:CRISPR-associated endonuclease Cas1 [Caldovatus aquaticus]|uniref:CRISPR-associated endonuclease Cas1 n=1 Tax=Caldovatus aquaticus TaxID=2865671 RepID=A0ABS7F071_9PROT|nr:CRISPR-associated endonuclease Cas1 [Caldovatus aquaticus]MBW8269026.1 CRISPR-associated endonuclease Cas1 [Caldovatus aquaticus]